MSKKYNNYNQKSFFFEDNSNKTYDKTNKKKLLIKEDRIYLLFFVFFCLISIFSIKIIFTSLNAVTHQKNSIYLNMPQRIFSDHSIY